MPVGWEVDDSTSVFSSSEDDMDVCSGNTDFQLQEEAVAVVQRRQPRQAALDARALVSAQLSDESIPDDDFVERLIKQQPQVLLGFFYFFIFRLLFACVTESLLFLLFATGSIS